MSVKVFALVQARSAMMGGYAAATGISPASDDPHGEADPHTKEAAQRPMTRAKGAD